jgi:hypothetical protein
LLKVGEVIEEMEEVVVIEGVKLLVQQEELLEGVLWNPFKTESLNNVQKNQN